MEELLNKLIKKGWKPFGWDDKLSSLHKEYGVGKWYIRFHNGMDSELFDLRQLTSKESGLWQFVCEKKIVNNKTDKFQTIYREKKYDDERDHDFSKKIIDNCDIRYEYRLIESALKDESDLEDFLLNSIKVD